MREFLLKSFDDSEIFVTIWDDVKSPKAVLQVCHGMAEYGGRYDRFARYMNSKGYIVFADDHRAHGRTEKTENLGRHKGNIFEQTLKDLVFFRSWLKNEYKLPVFFLGHSYGSFLGQAFAQAGTDCKAIALVGTGHFSLPAKFGKFFVAPLWVTLKNWRPKFVNKCSDLLHYKGDSGRGQWITSDKVSRQDYIDNPLCYIDMSINFDYCLLKETSKLYSFDSLSKLKPTTAIGLFCGDSDPVGGFGKRVKKLDKMYKENGIPCEMHMYEGMRHEVLNEVGFETAYKDISDFFDKYIIYSQTSIEDIGE